MWCWSFEVANLSWQMHQLYTFIIVPLQNYKLTVITVRWPLAQISYFLCMAYKIWYLMSLYSNQEQKMVPCEKYCFLHTLLNLENGHHKRPHNLWKEHTPTSPFLNGCMGPSRKQLSSWQLLTSSPMLKFRFCSLSITLNCSNRRFFKELSSSWKVPRKF